MIALAIALLVGVLLGGAIAWAIAAPRSQAQTHALEALVERAKNELGDTAASRASEKVGDLVDPVSKQLAEFNALVSKLETLRATDAGSLREQLASLLTRTEKLETATTSLSTQTTTLVTALRNPTTRGKWGEMQLRNVVEKAGMQLHCDFAEQQTIALESGKARPDMTVNLPDDRRVFVDSKAPVDALQTALDAQDDDTRKTLVKQYARALQDHVDALARRNYQSADGSADFVVMFVPGESFLSAACNENPLLLEYALDKGVLVTGPLALISLLRSFAMGWQAVRQEENAKRIAQIGRDLYDRALKFAEHLTSVRKNLERTVESFNGAVGSYETRLLPQGRKLKDEAALSDDDLPEIGVIDTVPRAITALDAGAKPTRLPRTQQLPLGDSQETA
ncbi:MAG TPA: DNA recombination protein RmuC [Candidatus Baltobacteraceae bacterium]|jgi:DNA recombination protein RmuC